MPNTTSYLLQKARMIEPFASYLENCGITEDAEIQKAARYHVENMKYIWRWDYATESEKKAMCDFVMRYC